MSDQLHNFSSLSSGLLGVTVLLLSFSDGLGKHGVSGLVAVLDVNRGRIDFLC